LYRDLSSRHGTRSTQEFIEHAFFQRREDDEMSYDFNSPWISVEQALMELENINKEHGIIGVIDAKGNFVYVSMEMIKKAIQVGRNAGRVLLPHVTKT